MSGPTPLTAPYRLQFLYTVDGLQHKCQNYCDVVASADPSGYDLVGAVAGHNVGLSYAAEAFFIAMAPFYNTAWSTFDAWVLQVFTGGAWVFLASNVLAATPTGGGAESVATGWAVSGKSQDNRNMPAYVYEGNFRALEKVNSYAALNANEKHIVDYFFDPTGIGTNTFAANWRMSRGSFHQNRWLACVWDSNQKLRRLRRIA